MHKWALHYEHKQHCATMMLSSRENNVRKIISNLAAISTSLRKKPRILWAVFIGIVLIGAGGTLYWYKWGNTSSNSTATDPAAAKIKKQEEVSQLGQALATTATPARESGDAAKVVQVYEQSVASKAGDSTAQAGLYLQLALTLQSMKQYQQTLDVAQKAYAIDKDGAYTFDLLPLIGYTAYRLGNKQLALEYIQKTYDYFKTYPSLEAGVLQETETFLSQLRQEAQQ